MSKIYTKQGDYGKTTLTNGKRVPKSDLRIEVCGTIDELNSLIGVSISNLRSQKSNVRKELIKIQSDLFEVGSNLASQVLASQGDALQSWEKRIKEFENLIDEMTEQMPKLSSFILPGGGRIGAMLHLARAICRRAERKIVELAEKYPSAGSGHGKIDSNILIYFNRLSDLFFTMARFVNFKEKRKEIIWKNQG